MKKDYSEFTKDLKELTIKFRRVWYARAVLTTEDILQAEKELDSALKMFTRTYGIDSETARDMAITVAETCNLGLAY